MAAPLILAILKAANVGAISMATALGLIHHVHKAEKNGEKLIKDFTDPETKNFVQKKLEEYDWSKFTQQQPIPYYGNRVNIKTLGGKSVLYDGNHSVSRWLFR